MNHSTINSLIVALVDAKKRHGGQSPVYLAGEGRSPLTVVLCEAEGYCLVTKGIEAKKVATVRQGRLDGHKVRS